MIWTSIFGILTLVLLARALGFARTPPLDEATARTAVEHAMPGFAPVKCILDATSRTAEVTARDGRIATVRPHGDRWVVR